MKRLHLALLLLIGWAAFCSAPTVYGRDSGRYSSRYRPMSPVLSPYFGLLRPEYGPLPNYHYYVRPRTQVRDTLKRQGSEIRQQDARIRSLRQKSGSVYQQRAWARPTGTGAGFMNYSHYYQFRR